MELFSYSGGQIACGGESSLAAKKDVLEDLRTGRGHLAAVHLKETVPGVLRAV